MKSASIYDKEKFGGDVHDLYKNDRNNFFKDFGINQIIKSIKDPDNYIKTIDLTFPKGHQYKIYPCLIVNDKALHTPLMADTFNERFKELVKKNSFRKVIINPLTIIHVSDLERIEESLFKTPENIWAYLEFNFRDRKFIPPFYTTVNQKLDFNEYPERIDELYLSLVRKYNPKGAEKTSVKIICIEDAA